MRKWLWPEIRAPPPTDPGQAMTLPVILGLAVPTGAYPGRYGGPERAILSADSADRYTQAVSARQKAAEKRQNGQDDEARTEPEARSLMDRLLRRLLDSPPKPHEKVRQERPKARYR